jgi:hypothetical protein
MSGLSQPPSPRDQTPEIEKIKAIMMARKHAWESRDFNRFTSLYDNSLSYHASNTPRHNKEMNYGQWRDWMWQQFQNPSRGQDKLHNMNITFSADTANAVFTQEGNLDQRQFRATDSLTFKMIGGIWKIVREHRELDETHPLTRQWMDELCYYGEWQENVPNQFRWTFWLEKNALKIKRADGFAYGAFNRSGDHWLGYLKWSNGTTWDNIILFKPNLDCSEIKTNQRWWYRR